MRRLTIAGSSLAAERTLLERMGRKQPVGGRVLQPGAPPFPPASGEEWRPVSGWPEYEVSDQGRVRRACAALGRRGGIVSPAGRVLRGSQTTDGYKHVRLVGPASVYVHRMVAEAFVPNPLGLPQVNHLNSVRDDNRAANLEWVTRSGNMRHAHAAGRFADQEFARGEAHGRTSLTDDEVRAMRTLHAGGSSYRVLSGRFGVAISTVGRIVRRQVWGHVS